MKIIIEDKAVKSVRRFYKNVAKKYKYSYSLQNMNKNIEIVGKYCDFLASAYEILLFHGYAKYEWFLHNLLI